MYTSIYAAAWPGTGALREPGFLVLGKDITVCWLPIIYTNAQIWGGATLMDVS